jgi:hypothetical protein
MISHSSGQFKIYGVNEAELRIWHMFFGALYGIQPVFANDTVAQIISDGYALLGIADRLGAVNRVRGIVELALLREAEFVWDSVASNPAIWASLGYQLRSYTILTEAVIHLVGNWRRIDRQVKDSMEPEVKKLVEGKYLDLEKAKMVIDLRIMGHYPAFMWRKAEDKPGRPSYANDIYAWMAVSHYRSYYAQAISEDQTRNASDGGYDFYSRIATGGQSYLDKPSFKQFHDMFPMSSKACNVLQDHMNVLKIDASKFVDGLLVNRAHSHDNPYLACCKVEKCDMPWHESDSDDESDDDGFDFNGAGGPSGAPRGKRFSGNGKGKGKVQVCEDEANNDGDHELDLNDSDEDLCNDEGPLPPSTPLPNSTRSSVLERPINDYDAIPNNSNHITAAPPQDNGFTDAGPSNGIPPDSPVREWDPDALFGPNISTIRPGNIITPSRIDPVLLAMSAQMNGQTGEDVEMRDGGGAAGAMGPS